METTKISKKNPLSGRKSDDWYIANKLPIPGTKSYYEAQGMKQRIVNPTDLTEVDPFDLEDAPITQGQANKKELITLYNRIDRTMLSPGIAVGKSFVVPKNRKLAVKKYLTVQYPNLNFVTKRIDGYKGEEGNFVRFIRTA